MAAAVSLHTLRNPDDGRVHFSDLKQFARSPMHYRHAVTTTREATRAMRVGTIVDRLLLGGKAPPVFEGDRRGKEWKAFEAAHAGQEIVTRAEFDDAEPIAVAALADPLARQYLAGQHQVRLEWEMLGVRCSTRGVDCVGDGWISDLKITSTTEPSRWIWHARRMHWHAQLAWYAAGCAANNIDTSRGLFLVGVEAAPPHPVTVLRLSPRALEEGQRCCHLWLEQLRACEATGMWPGYAQSVCDLDFEEPVQLLGLVDEDDDGAVP